MTECKICRRRLTNPLSVQRGIGPVCYAKLMTKTHKFKEVSLDENTVSNSQPTSEEKI